MTHKNQKRDLEQARAIRNASVNRKEARKKLLQQRKKLARRRRENRKMSAENRDQGQKDEANPTARSTVPDQKSNAENAARNSNSTVPTKPKHSRSPVEKRLYGTKLREAAEGMDDFPSDAHTEDEMDGGETS